MNIAVLGGGFVGTTTATVFAEGGHDVTLVEPDDRRRARLQNGEVPFYEPGLQDAYQRQVSTGHLHVRAALDAQHAQDIVYICVGTPSDADGAMDTRFVSRAAHDIAGAAEGWDRPFTVVVKSTVVPGTTRNVVLPPLEKRFGTPGSRYGVAMNPEFLREGSALADARKPDRIVYGTLGATAAAHMAELFGEQTCPVRATDLETAELCKYAANALLATKIGFANELARLAEAVGTDVDEVFATVGLDHRIAPSFLEAGPGFGGSCFPKDLKALADCARQNRVELGIVDAVLRSNDTQVQHVFDLLASTLASADDEDDPRSALSGKRVALLGAAFKPDTDDVRESRTLALHQLLVEAGAEVRIHDPMAQATYREATDLPYEAAPAVMDALAGADAAVLMTHWPDYQELAPGEVLGRMRGNVILDTRRVLDQRAYVQSGATFRALGRGDPGADSAAHDANGDAALDPNGTPAIIRTGTSEGDAA